MKTISIGVTEDVEIRGPYNIFVGYGIVNEKVHIVIIRFPENNALCLEQALDYIRKAGYRPANEKELLALRQQHRCEDFPICALGTVNEKEGKRFVPYIDPEKKWIPLCSWCSNHFHFAAVKV